MNEPSGLCSLIENGEFKGIYIADTGNDCIRFVNSSGILITPQLKGVPDVRETSSDCVGGQCVPDFGF